MNSILLSLFSAFIVVGLAVAVVEDQAGTWRRWYAGALGVLILGLLLVEPFSIPIQVWFVLLMFGYALVAWRRIVGEVLLAGAMLFAWFHWVVVDTSAIKAVGFIMLPFLLLLYERRVQQGMS